MSPQKTHEVIILGNLIKPSIACTDTCLRMQTLESQPANAQRGEGQGQFARARLARGRVRCEAPHGRADCGEGAPQPGA